MANKSKTQAQTAKPEVQKSKKVKKEKAEKPKKRKLDDELLTRENSFEWEQRDETMLLYAVQDKIESLSHDINNASKPSLKKKLVDEKKAFSSMHKKVKNGNYGSYDLYQKLAKAGVVADAAKRGKGNVSRYDTIDFKFDQYFLKTRYYGIALPLLIIVLVAAFVCVLILGTILPASVQKPIADLDLGLNFTSVYTFKLSPTEDIIAPNNGAWPGGTFQEGSTAVQGTVFVSPTGTKPDVVRLYADLGMQTVDISLWDIINAFFSTRLMSTYRINFIEDSAVMESADMFYARFMLDKDSYFSFARQADGTYNTNNLLYILAVYVTIYAAIGLLLCAACALVSSIVSLFTYTGRRLHIYAWFMIILSAICMILPCFLAIPSGIASGDCIGGFFSFTMDTFLANDKAVIMLNLPLILALVFGILILLVPKMFKNKAVKLPTYVPAGNRPPSQRIVEEASFRQSAYADFPVQPVVQAPPQTAVVGSRMPDGFRVDMSKLRGQTSARPKVQVTLKNPVPRITLGNGAPNLTKRR